MAPVRAPRTLAGALFGVQLLVMVAIIALVGGVGVLRAVNDVEAATEQRIEDVADTIRRLPAVVAALQGDNPQAEIQPIVDAALVASGFRYISVVDMAGIRVAHVDPNEVGLPVSSDHAPIRAGGEFRGVETGPQGETYRVKLPIRTDTGEVVGTISVGQLVSQIQQDARDQSLPIALTSVGAIVLGAAVAWAITRWLRRKLYGVAPEQLVPLLQAHQAVMESAQEGIVTVDANRRIQLVNSEAARLLGLTPEDVEDMMGRDLSVLPPVVAEPLSTEPLTSDAFLRPVGEFTAYVQAAEVRRDGRAVGRMVSLRDRTELDRASARLQEEQAAAELLRLEAHEFENRMHVVSGLLELGEYAEARAYLDGVTGPRLAGAIEVPLIAALLSSHAGVARGDNVTLEVDPDSAVPGDWNVADGELRVLANLITNAVEATGFGGHVRVLLRATPDPRQLLIRVDDDGPGFDAAPDDLLRRGTTSKQDPLRHGIGLAVVEKVVHGRGGRLLLGASPAGGARVEVLLPPEPAELGDDHQKEPI